MEKEKIEQHKKTLEAWNRLASEYQDKFMDFDLYNDTYDLFCLLIEKVNAEIFEIGCGPGNITRYLLSKRPDFKMVAIDMATDMVQLAIKNNPGADIKTMDCREIAQITSKFDGIMCGFCMPYLSNAESIQLIHDCSFLLKSGGLFYFSTIEGDYNKSGFVTSSNGKHQMYIYYHQEDYLQLAIKESKLELISLSRKTYMQGDGTSSTHIIFIIQKT